MSACGFCGTPLAQRSLRRHIRRFHNDRMTGLRCPTCHLYYSRHGLALHKCHPSSAITPLPLTEVISKAKELLEMIRNSGVRCIIKIDSNDSSWVARSNMTHNGDGPLKVIYLHSPSGTLRTKSQTEVEKSLECHLRESERLQGIADDLKKCQNIVDELKDSFETDQVLGKSTPLPPLFESAFQSPPAVEN